MFLFLYLSLRQCLWRLYQWVEVEVITLLAEMLGGWGPSVHGVGVVVGSGDGVKGCGVGVGCGMTHPIHLAFATAL